MTARRIGILGVVVAVVASSAAVVVAAPDAHAGDADRALQRARTAVLREDFSGVVQIGWLRRGSWQTARVPVSGTGGTVQVGDGARQAEGRGNVRWIAGVSGWQAGWDEPVRGATPRPSKHWDLSLAAGPEIAGRTTDVVTARDPETRAARLKVYIDRNTGVLMRREVLDARGRAVRSVGFVEVKKLGGSRAAPPDEPKARNAAPDKVTSLPKGYAAPRRVGDRYVLAGQYVRDDGVVQLYYSDGLFGVSLFQQRGEIDWKGLPNGGGRVAIDGDRGRDYEAAGGTVLVWEDDDVTFTAVSDATTRDLRVFASALASTTGGGGGVLHGFADFVLAPFGWE